ncbi:MAG: lipocalin-like domain-containing protein [Halieaceae bacterium]|nr:lipocalin-like domain-containing protein [Halieaceae bacterium]
MNRFTVFFVVLLCAACTRDAVEGIDVGDALGGVPAAGFERADAPRSFRFPEDHGSHPGFRNEWWYLTGNLRAADGRRFGYQATFFRIALAPGEPERASAWDARQLWMAHAALTDIDGGKHFHDQRFARAALGLAGQAQAPFRVWLEDWSVAGGQGGDFPWTLRVASDNFAVDLELLPERPPVLQGDDGLSQKSAEAGNASYYYSITRLATSGHLTADGERVAVIGSSWLDREWSTSALADDQVGWDWFSLQLASGRDLMFYRLRRCDGSSDPFSGGSLVNSPAVVQRLAVADVGLEAQRWWDSGDGHRYPVAWRLKLPEENLDLYVEAALDDQEMQTGVRYWEGAVDVWASSTKRRRLGQGYLEMTGYGPGARDRCQARRG